MRCFRWVLILAATLAALAEPPGAEVPKPAAGTVALLPAAKGTPRVYRPCGRLEHPALRECSGIVASRKHPGVFWVHNDSGNPAQLFAVDGSGKHLAGPIDVDGASNWDWEDIAMDDAGRLVVADVGNNFSFRRDLRVYLIPEPDLNAKRARVETTFRVAYADQILFPSPALEFDCEAVFAAGGELFFLTKHHTDTRTTLYRMDGKSAGADRVLRRVAEAEVRGRATGADISPDGRRLALLALNQLWLFELAGGPATAFQGRVRHLPLALGQAEAVAFDGAEALLVVNEQRRMFRIPVGDLEPAVRAQP